MDNTQVAALWYMFAIFHGLIGAAFMLTIVVFDDEASSTYC